MSTLRRCAALLVLIAVPLSLEAKPREQVFDASPDRVYAAVQKALRENYVVTFTDDKQMVVSFHTPSSAWTSDFLGSATVEGENGKGKLRITLQAVKHGNFGKGDRIEDSIMKWVGEELDKKN
jgi:hypothetical protein